MFWQVKEFVDKVAHIILNLLKWNSNLSFSHELMGAPQHNRHEQCITTLQKSATRDLQGLSIYNSTKIPAIQFNNKSWTHFPTSDSRVAVPPQQFAIIPQDTIRCACANMPKKIPTFPSNASLSVRKATTRLNFNNNRTFPREIHWAAVREITGGTAAEMQRP